AELERALGRDREWRRDVAHVRSGLLETLQQHFELSPFALRRLAQLLGERKRARALLTAFDCELHVFARRRIDSIVERERELSVRFALQIYRGRALQGERCRTFARPRREPRILLRRVIDRSHRE